MVVGAGLAGSEAAWQVARAGVRVVLHEMGDAYREARYAKIIAAVEAAWLPSALDPAAEALVAALRAGLAEAPV